MKLFLLVLSILLISSSSFGAEKYNVYLQNGKVVKNCEIYKSKEDPTILVLRKNGNRKEIKKTDIGSYNKVKDEKKKRTTTRYASTTNRNPDNSPERRWYLWYQGCCKGCRNTTCRNTCYNSYMIQISRLGK